MVGGSPKALYLISWILVGALSVPVISASNLPVACGGGKPGMVLSTHTDRIPGAVVEKVVIFPQRSAQESVCIERKGMLVRYPQAEATVVMCHGFMCDKFDTGFLRRLFPRGRFNTMSFDFRAHGEDKHNQFCTLGRDEAYDVIAAVRFLRQHPALKGKPVFVYGFSMGAVAAIEAQAKDPSLFEAMILDCPFDSTENIIKRGLETIKIPYIGYILQRYAFHPYVQSLIKSMLKVIAHMDSKDIATRVFPLAPSETVAQIKVPVFFIVCNKDEKVPVEAMKQTFTNCASLYKQLDITSGRGHFDSYFYHPERYTTRVRTFLDDMLKLIQENKLYKARKHEIIEDSEDYLAQQKSLEMPYEV